MSPLALAEVPTADLSGQIPIIFILHSCLQKRALGGEVYRLTHNRFKQCLQAGMGEGASSGSIIFLVKPSKNIAEILVTKFVLECWNSVRTHSVGSGEMNPWSLPLPPPEPSLHSGDLFCEKERLESIEARRASSQPGPESLPEWTLK